MPSAGSRDRRAPRRGRRWLAILGLALFAGGVLTPRLAEAQRYRVIRFIEDGSTLYAKFDFRWFFGAKLRAALRSGFQRLIYVQVKVRRGRRDMAYVVRNCTVEYDLWNQVYRVQAWSRLRHRAGKGWKVRDAAASQLHRVQKLGRAIRFASDVYVALGPTSMFKKRVMYHADVHIMFAPLPRGFLERQRRWLRYPLGSTPGLGTGLSLGTRIRIILGRYVKRALKETKFRSQRFFRR